jgi:hypothetical protein
VFLHKEGKKLLLGVSCKVLNATNLFMQQFTKVYKIVMCMKFDSMKRPEQVQGNEEVIFW